jgi:cell wall assembly regulator SMI1
MKTIWDRIHVWLAANAPEVLASLRPGATEEAIRAAEEAMGVTLPDDVKACYRIHDGQGPGQYGFAPGFLYGWQWCSLEAMVSVWASMKDFVEGGSGIPEDWRSVSDGPVREDWYHLAWIPLCDGLGGDLYCSDLAPAPGGQPGQIITWWHNDASRPIHALTFARWLAHFAEELESGKWVKSEEHHSLIEASLLAEDGP